MLRIKRVTDMASFAEDVHLLASASIDGRVFVWEIKDGTNEKHKPRITWEMVTLHPDNGRGELVHP
ncbi:hypothetical protein C5167_015693 [Papaver somniferum]|uniref:Anaphase-promoting complex subunit 4 WD40 domain-containing protein n=1 Tax=Papaver somniferum TaxID=3469 RepID=A0A4Y7JA79_PAPSO|nr:hypothetical protein C5167_015693 [Papaver somniferum]